MIHPTAQSYLEGAELKTFTINQQMAPQFLPIWIEDGDFKFRVKSVHFEENRWPKRIKIRPHKDSTGSVICKILEYLVKIQL